MECVECGESQEINFYPNNKIRCKACCNRRSTKIYHPRRREKQAAYYQKRYAEKGRKRAENYQDIVFLWKDEHPEAVKVHKLVEKAIRDGLLSRPLKCSICGRVGRINGHHEDYNSPYKVIWVCSSCHKKIHLGLLKGEKPTE